MYSVSLQHVPMKVFDQNGNEIEGAYVIHIGFPPKTIQTAEGPITILAGPGTAIIVVDGETIHGVPLAT